jgi:hypothetical protein
LRVSALISPTSWFDRVVPYQIRDVGLERFPHVRSVRLQADLVKSG